MQGLSSLDSPKATNPGLKTAFDYSRSGTENSNVRNKAGKMRMSRSSQQPQGDEGCLILLLKLALSITVLLGGWLGIFWAVNNGPYLIAKLKEENPALAERLADNGDTGNEENQDSHQSTTSTPQQVPTNIDWMKNADWLKSRHGGTYRTIKDFPWVKDGLTQQEAETTQDLLYMGVNDHETLKRVPDLQWTEDNITPPESKVVKWLKGLSYRDSNRSRKLTEMPFLGSVTEVDALLVSGLHQRFHRGTLAGFMQHPTVADGVIHHETLFAVAATTIDDESHLSRILNPGNATVETIQTSSPRTPNLS